MSSSYSKKIIVNEEAYGIFIQLCKKLIALKSTQN
jgi:hypothetical protein